MQSRRLREFLQDYHARFPGMTERGINAVSQGSAQARSYDTAADALSAVLHSRARVLDVGCGNGALLEALHARRPDLALAGADFSEEELRQARRRVPSAYLYATDVTQGIPGGSYDAISAHLVLHLLGPLDSVLHAMRGSLRCGGLVAAVVEDVTRASQFFSIITRALQQLGGTQESALIAEHADMVSLMQPTEAFRAAGFSILEDRDISVESTQHTAAAELIAHSYPFGLIDRSRRSEAVQHVLAQLHDAPSFTLPLRLIVART